MTKIVPPRRDPDTAAEDGVKFGTQVISEGVALDVNAILLVARVSDALLEHHRQAIATGQKPEGGPQRPLSQGRREDAGRAGPHRGYATGHLADDLRRSRIAGTAQSASAKILPPTDRNVFIAEEAKRGVGYLSTDGIAAEVAKRAAEAATAELASGKPGKVDVGETADTKGRAPSDRSEAARRGWQARRARTQGGP